MLLRRSVGASHFAQAGLFLIATMAIQLPAQQPIHVVDKDGNQQAIEVEAVKEYSHLVLHKKGYLHGQLPAGLTNITHIWLHANNLTNLVVPPDLIRLERIYLNSNHEMNHITLQQDTGLLEPKELLLILGRVSSINISIPKRMEGRILFNYWKTHPPSNAKLTWGIRPNEVDIIRWNNEIIVVHSNGRLQRSTLIKGDWNYATTRRYDPKIIGAMFFRIKPKE